jgi:predicted RecB family nuclease
LESGEREILKSILDYNEDDVRATRVVKDFLTNL